MRLLVCLLVVLAVSGCATMQPHTLSDPEGRALVNERATGQQARLVLTDGTWIRADALRLDGDSLSWIDPEIGTAQAAALPAVATVSFSKQRSVGRAVTMGFVWGGSVGALAAGVAATTEGDLYYAPVAVLALGAVGAALGLFYSVDQEVRDVYEAK